MSMTAMERVLTALSHREADRVPFFLFLTLHGVKELGLSIREYFAKAEHVAEGQLRLRAKYGHDCLCPFFYAPLEVEAFGGETIWHEDGPPNSGQPPIRKAEDILALQPPEIEATAGLVRVLTAIACLKEQAKGTVPIIGVVMSPFSLPVMQMGFAAYLDLLHEQPALFRRLTAVNQEFCVAWANAQLKAGATAICYFDPLVSPAVIQPELSRQTGFPLARQTLARIQGPTATHLASAQCLPVLDDLAATGTAAVGVSALEDLAEVKAACKGRLTVIGNLNGIAMRRWTAAQAEAKVKEAIAKAAAGGGFILADNHGEIPWQVSDEVLLTIADAVREWGRYSGQDNRPCR